MWFEFNSKTDNARNKNLQTKKKIFSLSAGLAYKKGHQQSK